MSDAAPRRRRRRPRGTGRARRALRKTAAFVGAAACGFALTQCASPPEHPDDACRIFREKRSWYRDAVRTRNRWGVPEGVQLAIVHQESSFRANARPPRSRILWIFPGPRPSSAFGYGQVIDETWDIYRRKSGNGGADRDDFGDVSDFIGWYAAQIERRAGIPRDDAYRLYLAYHEGPGGFVRGSYRKKDWLKRVGRKVERRARRYDAQIALCRDSLRGPWWWPF